MKFTSILLLVIVLPCTARGALVLRTFSTMDVQVSSISVGDVAYDTLRQLLGDQGELAIYASSGRIGLIDPFTQTTGNATAYSSLDLAINGDAISIGAANVLPPRSFPANSLHELQVGDHFTSSTMGGLTLNTIGDSAFSASAPYFAVFVANSTESLVHITFDYILTQGGTVLETIPLSTFEFGDSPMSASGATVIGTSSSQSIVESGGLYRSTSAHDDFFESYADTLAVTIAGNSENLVIFYNTHIASGRLRELSTGGEIPEPSTLAIWASIALIGLFAGWRGRGKPNSCRRE